MNVLLPDKTFSFFICLAHSTQKHTHTSFLRQSQTERETELRTSLTNDKKSEREDSVVSLNPAKSLVVGEYIKMLFFFFL